MNDGQRDCLRLVLAHLNSKEIARELGVSPHTVDQRLRTAMRILNVQSRFEAARKFAAENQQQSYQPLIYQSSTVELAGQTSEQGSSSGRPKDRKPAERMMVRMRIAAAPSWLWSKPKSRAGRFPFHVSVVRKTDLLRSSGWDGYWPLRLDPPYLLAVWSQDWKRFPGSTDKRHPPPANAFAR
ncbi:helix-turn-helix transcriptional regulator [Sphingopyxis sp. BSNA05]|uniref:helix-turn-helix domain-containing protein n=1 Tax=Sphingopyxis sp. BSNA05 TaxID=1236614 RepID=UPI0020B63CE9|nr:helix-turn-helix transcriptional regulator [Sphingopyxis sp. BSNA05]